MKKLITNSLAVVMIVAAAFYGCQDLDVQNTNNPDEARALATPGDIESLIQGSFNAWFDALESGQPNMSFAVMSDAYTCSWGNYGMGALSQEPRVEFNNTTAYSRSNITEDPWFGLYSAISSASDGFRNIESGNVTLGPNNERALAFAKFVQGISTGWIALAFDQGFILDENTDLSGEVLQLRPYTEIMDAAIQQLEGAITIANANTFDLPADWLNNRAYSSKELAEIAHSFIARYMAWVARTPADRANVNWSAVLSHIDQGITEDFGITGNGGGRGDPWWNSVQWYSAEHGTWNRVDYRTIGPSDEGADYSTWSSNAPGDRSEFIMQSGDLRIWDGTLAGDGTQNPGLYIKQIGSTTFPGGSYQKSRYGQEQFREYRYVTLTGSLAPLMRLNEHDFLRAEALLHTGGSAAEIAAILDVYHVGNGGYPSAAGASVGSINDDPDPKPGASLWSIFKYEKIIENLGVFPGGEFFDKRGWGDLTPLTLLHFPVPALDLETLQLALYSHGGPVGDSAPKRLNDAAETLRPFVQ